MNDVLKPDSSNAVVTTDAAARVRMKCAATVWSKERWSRPYPCDKPATKEHEGKHYCGTHYPPNVKARQDERMAAYRAKNKAENDARQEQLKRFDAYPRLVSALKESIAINRDWLKDVGPCDHSVNICFCADIRTVDALESMLKELGE